MYTVCPKCALTLVVTAADLRVAQGYVRCGRCSNVFNAIVGLSEDRQGVPSPPASSGTATTSIMRKAPSIADNTPEDSSATDETEALSAEPDVGAHDASGGEISVEIPPPPDTRTTLTAGHAGASGSVTRENAPPDPDAVPDSALEFNPQATDVSKVFVEAAPARKIDLGEVTGTFEQIVLRSEGVPDSTPAAGARDPADVELENELRSLAARLDATGEHAGDASQTARGGASDAAAGDYGGSPYNSADSPAIQALKATRRSAAKSPSDSQAADAPSEAALADPAAALTRPPGSHKRRVAWIFGSIALCLALAAQVIHHNRNELATHPSLNRPLTRFYAALGVPLVPRWNLALYDVHQLGAFSAGGDNANLTVRASVKNTATQPLPLPLLRITVQDRYGNRIASRDVPPRGYLSGAVPEGALLGAGQRIDAEMTFKDPGRDAVGFEIDACLPRAEGNIACANDAAALAAR